MLRYLLPTTGVRWIWVDAICINQSSLKERSCQISKMGAIYRNCLRVVLFLGRDATTRQDQDQGLGTLSMIPPRRELQSADSVTLDEMLSFRYFKRVWVVQELLLAPSIMIPFKGVHYRVNGGTPSKTYPLDWEQVNVSWFQLAAKILHFRLDLFDILQMTRFCESSDPRDKIYGVLGTIQNQTTGGGASGTLSASYSISSMHAFVGAFADLIINSKRIEILLVGAGCNAPKGHPTWLPQMGHQRQTFPSVFSWSQPGQNAYRDSDSIAIQTPWYRYPVSVGSKTCCLTLWPVRFLTIKDDMIVTIKEMGDDTKAIAIGNYSFIAAGPSIDLPSLVKPGVTEVFLIGPPLMVLFLNCTMRGTHRLVVVFRCHEIGYNFTITRRTSTDFYEEEEDWSDSSGLSLENRGNTCTFFPVLESYLNGRPVPPLRKIPMRMSSENTPPLYQSLEDRWQWLQSELQSLVDRMKAKEWQTEDAVGAFFPGVHWTSWRDVARFWMLCMPPRTDYQWKQYGSLIHRLTGKRIESKEIKRYWTEIRIPFSSREEEAWLMEFFQAPDNEEAARWPWRKRFSCIVGDLLSHEESSPSQHLGAVHVETEDARLLDSLSCDRHHVLMENILEVQGQLEEEDREDILHLLEKPLPDKYRFTNAYPLSTFTMLNPHPDIYKKTHEEYLRATHLKLCRVSIE